MHTRILLICSGLFVLGCATVTTMQNHCEKTTVTFVDMVACTKTAIEADSRPVMHDDPRIKLYLLRADQLAARVSNGQLSELDARAELQQILVDQNAAERAERPAMPVYRPPRRTTCQTSGNQTTCNSN